MSSLDVLVHFRVFLFLEEFSLLLLLLLQIKTKEETNVVLVLAINKKSRAMRLPLSLVHSMRY